MLQVRRNEYARKGVDEEKGHRDASAYENTSKQKNLRVIIKIEQWEHISPLQGVNIKGKRKYENNSFKEGTQILH